MSALEFEYIMRFNKHYGGDKTPLSTANNPLLLIRVN